ncbi:hypothetical protein [Actinocrispum wychmicini]|uniref:Uncharacterized protein n=1 Tax=Actinocrispum wychmicini TaxID=1213861 RepID=A0A4R2JVQ6_9PSEU|nr:hypothetical protein [Actinocrispum wychmicini]TCO58245.1 hypothetical protein EV192_105310 [Actinocrispum wychmicini]
MSTYPTTPAQGNRTGAAPVRPGTLKAAVLIAVVVGLAEVVNAVVMLTGGMDLAAKLAAKGLDILNLDLGADLNNQVIKEAATQMQSTLQGRAFILLVFGVGMLLFGLLMTKAATWARVLVTIFAALTLGMSGFVLLDVNTTLMMVLGAVATLGAIVSIVTTWLGPNGRYAKALKA